MLLRRFRQVRDVVHVVDADDHLAAADLGQLRQTVDLGRIADLVRDQDVGDASGDQDLRLGDLLHALPDRAVRDLMPCDIGAFMRLRMRPQPHPVFLHMRRHRREIALECVEIEDEGRRIDLGEALPDLGRLTRWHEVQIPRNHSVQWIAARCREQGLRHRGAAAVALCRAP